MTDPICDQNAFPLKSFYDLIQNKIQNSKHNTPIFFPVLDSCVFVFSVLKKRSKKQVTFRAKNSPKSSYRSSVEHLKNFWNA